MDGTASAGSEAAFARGDHVHGTDTTRAPLASPALSGTPTAPTAAAKNYTTQIATTKWARDNLQPVGTYYTQYPAAASNDLATAFPEAERPGTLFGGNWATCWESEQIFFRTGGSQAADAGRCNGYQADAFQGHTHSVSAEISGHIGFGTWWGTTGNSLQDPGAYIQGPSEYGYGAPRVAAETRPVNRRIIVWRKYAL
jgi:hypothetical protein